MANRDTTAANLALMDKSGLARRRQMVEEMVAAGAQSKEIVAVTRAETGYGPSPKYIAKVRRALARSNRSKKAAVTRAKNRAARGGLAELPSPPAELPPPPTFTAAMPRKDLSVTDLIAASINAGHAVRIEMNGLAVSAIEIQKGRAQ